MDSRIFSIKWLAYHLYSLGRFIYLFLPLKAHKTKAPLSFTPGGAWGTFLFSSFSCVMIFAPIFIYGLIFIHSGILVPEVFIMSLFGLIFSIIYRNVQNKTASYIYFDGRDVFYTVFGFIEAVTEVFDKNTISGLVIVRTKFRSTKNYKICMQLSDNRLIMLKIVLSKEKSEKLLEKYLVLFDTQRIENPSSNQPDNDTNIGLV